MTKGGQVRVLNRRTFQSGDTIFREGETGSVAFVVQQGRVRIQRGLKSGGHATIGHVEEGGIFGEMALIDRSPRMATAVADGAVTCIVIPEDTVRTKLQAADPVVRTLITVLIRMIRHIADETPLEADAMAALEAASETGENAG